MANKILKTYQRPKGSNENDVCWKWHKGIHEMSLIVEMESKLKSD